MCIIIAKKKGVKFPSVENVEQSCVRNPNGFAMAWYEKKKIKTFRTMDKKTFLEKYKEISSRLNYKETPLMIHARVATHGSIGIKNTHCFVDNDIKMCFSHNGILSIKNREDMTDSETFFRDIFVPLYKMGGWKKARLAVNAIIGTSKFAFIDKDGELYTFGNFVKDEDDDVLYSNNTYKKYTYTYLNIGWDKWGRGSRSYGGYNGGAKKAETKKETKKNPERLGTVIKREFGKYSDYFYDVHKDEYVYRKDETDAEWFEKKRKGEYFFPTEHSFSSSVHEEDYCPY